LDPVLEVASIDVFYDQIQALRGVSLRVGEGEMVALVGANGAGKTTTLRTISGLLAPTSGEITFEGKRIHGLDPWKVVERGIAHLPEGRELFSDLSVLDNLRLGNWPIRNKGKADALADRVMQHFPILRERRNQAAGTLSGGEQQMLGVARALMSQPRLLIVDELSLGLAPQIVSQLFDILREVNAQGTSVLLVEQFVHMALTHTHRAYALVKGEVALEGESRKLLDSPELMAAYLGEATPGTPDVSTNGKVASTATKKRKRSATKAASTISIDGKEKHETDSD
jgi:branched-chain amino acid transport system ATP-binding protein